MSFFATIWMRSGEATDVPPNFATISDMVLFLVRLNPIGCPLYQTTCLPSQSDRRHLPFFHGETTSERLSDAYTCKTNGRPRTVATSSATSYTCSSSAGVTTSHGSPCATTRPPASATRWSL